MVNSRQKGAGFERKIAKLLYEELGINFKRNLEQYRSIDQSDLIPDDPKFPFSIELKSRASGVGCKNDWWKQSVSAAEAVKKFPCVIYKYDRYPERVVISNAALASSYGFTHACDFKVEMSLESFCIVCREIMSSNINS